MSTTKFNVLKKDGTSYIELGYYSDGYLVNGKPLVQCPGNKNWGMIEGDITSIEKIIPGGRKHTGFTLKPEFRGIVSNLIETNLTPDTLIYDYETNEWAGTHAELYNATYEDLPDVLEDIEFEVIDYDCEPVQIPAYVHIDFPANLRFYQCVHHKYPCHIKMPQVFDLVASAIVAEAKKYPALYSLHDCRNIQVLGVDVTIDIQPKVERRDTNPFGKRPKWKNVTITTLKKRIFSIVGTYNNKTDSEQIEEVRGANYEELQENLRIYIEGFTSRIDPRRWHVCDKCDGSGLILTDEVKK